MPLSLNFFILFLSFFLKFSFSSENRIAIRTRNEICVDMEEVSNFISTTNSILIKIQSEYFKKNQINSKNTTYGQYLIYPNKNIFQNIILPFFNTNDLIKIIRVFQFKNINVTNFFPTTFHTKQIVSMNENAKFVIFPDSSNLDTVLFFQNQNEFFFLSTQSTSHVDVNENLDYVLLQNEIKHFKFKYPRVDKEKNKTFAILLAISEEQFVVALKKADKIKIIWHGNFTKLSVERPGETDEELSLGAFEISFPQDVDLILKSRKYSKKYVFKILHRYLNFIDRYYRCVIPNLNKNLENCFDGVLFFIFSISLFCGYGLILALPLFLETNLLFLPLLWKNPKFIFYTSFFSAVVWMIHLIHLDTKNINECWLFPHLKAWKRDIILTIVHIFFMWGIINAFIAIYSVWYFQPYYFLTLVTTFLQKMLQYR